MFKDPRIQKQLLENNMPKMIQNIEDKHLGSFKTIKLQLSATQ